MRGDSGSTRRALGLRGAPGHSSVCAGGRSCVCGVVGSSCRGGRASNLLHHTGWGAAPLLPAAAAVPAAAGAGWGRALGGAAPRPARSGSSCGACGLSACAHKPVCKPVCKDGCFPRPLRLPWPPSHLRHALECWRGLPGGLGASLQEMGRIPEACKKCKRRPSQREPTHLHAAAYAWQALGRRLRPAPDGGRPLWLGGLRHGPPAPTHAPHSTDVNVGERRRPNGPVAPRWQTQHVSRELVSAWRSPGHLHRTTTLLHTLCIQAQPAPCPLAAELQPHGASRGLQGRMAARMIASPLLTALGSGAGAEAPRQQPSRLSRPTRPTQWAPAAQPFQPPAAQQPWQRPSRHHRRTALRCRSSKEVRHGGLGWWPRCKHALAGGCR